MGSGSKKPKEVNMEALNIIRGLGFCGCGNPEDGYEALRAALHAHHNEGGTQDSWAKRVEKVKAWEEKIDKGNALLLRYFIDAADLMEHGSSVYGGWLSEKGIKVLGFLNDFGTDPDNWE